MWRDAARVCSVSPSRYPATRSQVLLPQFWGLQVAPLIILRRMDHSQDQETARGQQGEQ